MSQDAGRITLIRTSTGWSAKFEGEVLETVRSAFGTDTIPTAYTAAAPASKVRQAIRYIWPRCIVTIQEGQ